LVHSFSPDFFRRHLDGLNLETQFHYSTYEKESLFGFKAWAANLNLIGLNVTLPYKEQVLSYADHISEEASAIGASNTLLFKKDGTIWAYNTDCQGFAESLFEIRAASKIKSALILGTGGASKAIQYVLKSNGIEYKLAGRNPLSDIAFNSLEQLDLEGFNLVVNCTPLGTYPLINEAPKLLYESLNENHLVYDLVYNPSPSLFLTKALNQGCTILSGRRMLEIQALSSWDIWYKYLVASEEGLFL